MLAEIMQKTIKAIPSGSSIVDAAEKMRKERVGALLVQDEGEFVGILTEADIVRKAVGNKKNIEDTTVESLMTTDLPTIQISRTSHEAFDMMGDLGVRHLIICDGEQVVGLVSVRDLLMYFRSFEPSIGSD